MDFIKTKYEMKHFFKILIFAIVITGCQKEFENIIEPDKNEVISEGDSIAELLVKVALKDGSFDNIIDSCSAVSLNFPYSITVNEQLLQINSPEDIEMIKLEYSEEPESIHIIFPVTIIFSDYTEKVLNNSDELENIQKQYNANIEDDDIECLDFVYPLNLCIYNTVFQNSDCFAVNNDYELYSLFSDITDLVIELEYPIQLSASNNDLFTVNDNTELGYLIDNISGSCDEYDDVDEYDDDEYDDVDETDFTTLLTSALWYNTYYSDSINETNSCTNLLFDFDSDYSFQVTNGTESTFGIWGYELSGSWQVITIDSDTEEIPFVWLN